MQALSISLSAQQGRLTQVANRLDVITDQLNKATDKSQGLSKDLADAQTALSASTVETRTLVEGRVRLAKFEFDQAAAEENAVRARYNDALNVFRAEEARWLELVAKLDDIIKR
jgi:archaellum component FlaC